MKKANIKPVLKSLEKIAVDTIRRCTFKKESKFFSQSAERDLLLPSSDGKYHSFWIIDTTLVAQSGLLSSSQLLQYVEIIATHAQNGKEEKILENGLTVPPFCVADHINYDGGAVFFPGTYSDKNNQGDGSYGFFPPVANNYLFTLLVECYLKQSSDVSILKREYNGISLIERLKLAFASPKIDEDGLIISDAERHTVDWSFFDAVQKSGKLFMGSALRAVCADALSRLLSQIGDEEWKIYKNCANELKRKLVSTFYDEETGWFYASTGLCRQYDVWGTAYAVYTGICENQKTLDALYNAYKNKDAVSDGYVRQVLKSDDFAENTAWEKSIFPYNTYMNGGYWATPTGWYAYALYKRDGGLDILCDFLAHTQKYAENGAPFEWKNATGDKFEGAGYGTSAVMPYIGALKIFSEQ